MTKAELEQYRSIVAELDEIRDRLNRNTVHGVVTGSDSEFPYVQHHIPVGGVVESPRNEKDMLLCRELEKRIADIELFVASIPDSVTRRIFRYRYIEEGKRPTWIQVTKKVFPALERDEVLKMAESVRKTHSRYLKKI